MYNSLTVLFSKQSSNSYLISKRSLIDGAAAGAVPTMAALPASYKANKMRMCFIWSHAVPGDLKSNDRKR